MLDITAMHQAARTVGELARPEAESIAAELTACYRTINQPLRRPAKHLGMEGLDEAGSLMEALAFLTPLGNQRVPQPRPQGRDRADRGA